MAQQNSYTRCFYTSPEGFECETWFAPANDADKLCPVHSGVVSVDLASNGHNKDSYIAKRNAEQFSILAAIEGMSAQESLKWIDQHIAGIEKVIEEQKILVQTARAMKQIELEKLSEDERAELRKMRVTAPREKREKKPSSANELGKQMAAREKAIAGIIDMRAKQGLTTSREKAITLLDME